MKGFTSGDGDPLKVKQINLHTIRFEARSLLGRVLAPQAFSSCFPACVAVFSDIQLLEIYGHSQMIYKKLQVF